MFIKPHQIFFLTDDAQLSVSFPPDSYQVPQFRKSVTTKSRSGKRLRMGCNMSSQVLPSWVLSPTYGDLGSLECPWLGRDDPEEANRMLLIRGKCLSLSLLEPFQAPHLGPHHLELVLGTPLRVSDLPAQRLPSLPCFVVSFHLCRVLSLAYSVLLPPLSVGPTPSLCTETVWRSNSLKLWRWLPQFSWPTRVSSWCSRIISLDSNYLSWAPSSYCQEISCRYVAPWFRQLFTYSPTSLVLWNTARGHIFLSRDSRE